MDENSEIGKLYIVPTPIGNLEDITLRALRILKESDLILAEDTRSSAVLLNHFEIKTAVSSYHKFNEHKRVNAILDNLKLGKQIALISDAGTPGISDPGFLLIRKCVEYNIPVECLPGATALIPALVESGMPSDRFCFEGFLPHKKGRQTRLELLTEENRTMVLYESPYRVVKTLSQLAEYLGYDREVSVSREISKVYAETLRGTLSQMVKYFTENNPRGEFVLVVAGKSK